MHLWNVKTPVDDQRAEAMKAETTPDGDSLFGRQDGELQQAFGRGAWSQRVPVKRLGAGYGAQS